MSVSSEPLGVSTRRAVTRILGSAETLPQRSKASKVLTAVACRIQLFVFEAERAHPEHFGRGIEALLWRLQQHCQLLAVADRNGGGVQSGYALLSELSELLEDLEELILLLPAQLGNDERYKPALDELQALLANVSLYRMECDDTRSNLEAALSELVQGTSVWCDHASERTDVVQADGTLTAASETALYVGSGARVAVGRSAAEEAAPPLAGTGGGGGGGGRGAVGGGKATATAATEDGGDQALLQRVRQLICALDLDVDVAKRDQDLEAELLQLRDHMQQALEQQQLLQPKHDQDTSKAPEGLLAATRQGGRRWPPPQQGEHEHTLPMLPRQPSQPPPPPLSRVDAHKWRGRGSEGAWAVHQGSDGAAQGAAAVIRPLPYIPPGPVERQGGRRWREGAPLASEPDEGAQPRNNALRRSSSTLPVSDSGKDDGKGGRIRVLDAHQVTRQLAAQHLAQLKEQRRRLFRSGGQDQDGRGDEGSAGGKDDDAQGSRSSSSDDISPWTVRRPVRVRPIQATAAAAAVGSDTSGVCDSDGQTRPAGASTVTRRAMSSVHLADPAAGTSVSHWGDEEDSNHATDDGAVYDGNGASDADGGGGAAIVAAWDREASVAAVRHLNRVTTLAGMWEAGGPLAAPPTAPPPTTGTVVAADGSGGETDAGRPADVAPGGLKGGPSGAQPRLAAPPAPAALLPALTAALPDLGPGLRMRCPPRSPFVLMQQRALAQLQPQPPEIGPELPPPESHAPAPRPGRLKLPGVAAAAAAGPGAEEVPSPAAAGPGGVVVTVSSPKAGGAGPGLGPQQQQRQAEVPPPLPRPDALVYLRAVGAPGSPGGPRASPPLAHQGPFLPPGYGIWPWMGPPGEPGGAAAVGRPQHQQPPLLDFGPDVPTLDLRRDITSAVTFLGRGAFGAVYKAMLQDKPAAVKVLYGSALDATDLDSLRSEIRLLCGLQKHPNIITVYGAAVAPPDQVALVTELMDCDLYDYIHRRRQNCVPLGEVLFIARCIANGLSGLHPAVVHRDLKPANVLLKRVAPHHLAQQPQPQQSSGSGGGGIGSGGGGGQMAQAGSFGERRLVVKIADFGLARHKRSQYLSTRDGQAGTLKYMAPECFASGGSGGGARGGAEGPEGRTGITEKCDIFSFGVLLYELITGREPWEGYLDLYAFSQVRDGQRLTLPDDPARCPDPLRALVEQCWAAQHHDRPSSTELVRRLDAMMSQLAAQGLLQDGEVPA